MWDRLNSALIQLDLADWLESYADIKSTEGPEIRIQDCPICGNDKYKLYINTDKNVWNCKVCDWGRGIGDVVQLMAAVSGKSTTAIRMELLAMVPLAPAGDISSLLLEAFNDTSTEEEDDYGFVEIDPPGYPTFEGLVSAEIKNYAIARGLTEQDIKELGLRAAATLISPKGSKMSGPFLVFPIQIGKKTVSWQGRRTFEKDPKYVSAGNVKDWVYPLGDKFFSLYKGTLFIVEGVFDALGMQRLGIPALCTFGTSISNKQLDLLKELKPEKVCFAWDLGAHKEVIKTITRVSYHFPKTCVAMTDGKLDNAKIDAGEALRNVEAAKWVLRNVTDENMQDVRSPEFFKWQITKI